MKENSHKNLHIKQERNEQEGKNKTGQNYLLNTTKTRQWYQILTNRVNNLHCKPTQTKI
jgi:hypothetical protein